MDKIEKFFRKARLYEEKIANITITQITSRNFSGLNCKKLSGYKNYYRVKKGKIRVVFYMDESKVVIVDIGRRDDNTYKQF